MGKFVYEVRFPAMSEEMVKRKTEIEIEHSKTDKADGFFKKVLNDTKTSVRDNKKLKKGKMGEKVYKFLEKSKIKSMGDAKKVFENKFNMGWYQKIFYQYMGDKTIRVTIFAPVKSKWIKKLVMPMAKFGWKSFSRSAKFKIIEEDDDLDYLNLGLEMKP